MTDKDDDFHKLVGPVLLLAGPGTGKTYRLAKRIKYLVEEKGVSPSNVTVITFTAPAARNMHEKISDSSKKETYVSVDKQPEKICTMHSLGHRIIREKAEELGFEDTIYVLFSDAVRKIIVEDAAQIAGCSREEGREVISCRQMGKCVSSTANKCKICEQYEKILRRCSAVDHDDQILLACKLLKEHPDLLAKYKAMCQHLLVDEYQDINAGQFELISLLTEDQREGLFVVGDDDQSIYSWRGGSPEYIRAFGKHFGKDAKIKPLLKSYRCRPHVLESAMAVVQAHDKGRLSKGRFEYAKSEGAKVVMHNTPSDDKEANIVLRIAQKAMPAKNVLVLIPNKYFATSIVQALRKAKIKYTAPSRSPGDGLPLISTLSKWLSDVNDSMALRECINAFVESPESGIPSHRVRKSDKIKQREQALMSISKLWINVLDGKAQNLWESLQIERKRDKLCHELCATLEDLVKMRAEDDSPTNFISKVMLKLAPWKKVSGLLDEIDSWVETSGRENPGQGPGLELMTFQSAKGLEADVVCVIGLEDGIVPKDTGVPEHMAEQSRLMLVTMTRAKEELHLFHARNRSASVMLRQLYSKGKPPDISPSRFLSSIPAEHKEMIYHKT